MIERHIERAPGGLGGLDHPLRFGSAARQRLFGHDMLTGLQRGHGHGHMQVVGRGDADHVDIIAREHLLPVAVGVRHGMFLAHLVQTVGVGVRNRDDLHAGQRFVCLQMGFAGPAKADHCRAQRRQRFAHERSPVSMREECGAQRMPRPR